MPVARSRPRGLRMPMSSMTAGSDHVEGDEPVEGGRSDQERGGTAGRADVREGVPGERLSPDDREHSHDSRHDRRDRADDQGDLDRLRREEPGFEQGGPGGCDEHHALAKKGVGVTGMVGLMLGARDDQHPALDVDHLDVVAIEPAEGFGSDHLVGRARCGPAVGQVDDVVHDRQQRVHVVRGEQDRDVLFGGDPGQELDHLGGGADVQVRQRLVEQQQLRAGDERLGDHDPLLLSTRQVPDPGVREPGRSDRVEHLVHGETTLRRRPGDPEAVAVETEPDQVPGPQRHVRLEDDLLGDVTDLRVPS